MKIELATRSTDTLKITWPAYPADMEAEIIRRLNTVPGIEGESPRYTAPAIQCERLMQLFPKASFDYSALQAADRIARNFFDSLNNTGVKLVIDGDRVRAIGDNVSPLIEQLVNDRSPALMSFVLLEMDRRQLVAAQRPMGVEDARLEVLGKGIVNAKRKAEQQFNYGKRRGKAKPEQGELFR